MKKVAYDPSRSVELNDYMREQGVELGWRVLGHEWARADQDIAAGLKIRRGAKTLRIRRLRLAQGRIIGYHFAHVPEKFAALVNLDALDTGGSMDYLLQLPAMQKPLVQRTLEARVARADEARLLKMKVGAPVLYLERIVVGIDGSPIEFLVAAFCGERFKYKITL
jgi:GntR family transcriptional regulator